MYAFSHNYMKTCIFHWSTVYTYLLNLPSYVFFFFFQIITILCYSFYFITVLLFLYFIVSSKNVHNFFLIWFYVMLNNFLTFSQPYMIQNYMAKIKYYLLYVYNINVCVIWKKGFKLLMCYLTRHLKFY